MRLGTFTKTGFGYAGNLKTLTVNAELTLEANRGAGNFAFRVLHGTIEIGVAITKTSKKSGKEYLLVIINDPAFPQAVFADLITSIDKDEIPLMWDGYSEPKAQAGQ